MTYFRDKDLELIEKLEFNPILEPSYDAIKNCLVWEDERPDGLTPDGYEKLCDLWIARSFIYRDIPFSECESDSSYYERVWKKAMDVNFKWPGFKRMNLSEDEKAYYQYKIEEQNYSSDGI